MYSDDVGDVGGWYGREVMAAAAAAAAYAVDTVDEAVARFSCDCVGSEPSKVMLRYFDLKARRARTLGVGCGEAEDWYLVNAVMDEDLGGPVHPNCRRRL